MRYAIWNNKGGVGKTFLSFILASEYALKHPDARVYVIDLCPQANVSEILLGGNGGGADRLQTFINERKTIGGYFDKRIKTPHNKTGNESSYVIETTEHNPNLPKNLFLIAGDPSLEIQAQAMNQISGQSLPLDSWKNVHLWVKDITDAIESNYDKTVIFIDCNPSFATYTELAMVAAEKLIVPCSADSSSARAVDNIASLLYGYNVPQEYENINFFSRTRQNGLARPTIKVIALNRSTQYDSRASKGFIAMFEEIKKRGRNLKENTTALTTDTDDIFIDVPDIHTVSIVSSYEGRPLSKMNAGKHTVHDKVIQVNSERLAIYREAIDGIVSKL